MNNIPHFLHFQATFANGKPSENLSPTDPTNAGTPSIPAISPPPANTLNPITTPNDTQMTPNEPQAPIANEAPYETLKRLLAQKLSVQDILDLFTSVPSEEKFKLLESFSLLSTFSDSNPTVKRVIDTATEFMKSLARSTNAFGMPFPSIGNFMSGLINANPIRNAKDQLFSAGVNGVANKLDNLNRYRRVGTDFLGDGVRFGRNLANPLMRLLPFGAGNAIAGRMDNAQQNMNNVDEFLNNTNQNLVGGLKNYADKKDLQTDERRLLAAESAQQ